MREINETNEIKVTRMSPAAALSKARADRVLRYDRYLGAGFKAKAMDSFQLKDGRYACKDYDPQMDCEYYVVYEGIPAEIVSELDKFDHEELLGERYKAENESLEPIKGRELEEDENEEEGIPSPLSQKSYNDWFAREMAPDIAEEEPQDPAKEIVRMFIAALSKNDWLLFKFCFDSNMTTADIMDELNIPSKQALSNRKARFLDKLREVFRAAGYEVPTAQELHAGKNAAKKIA